MCEKNYTLSSVIQAFGGPNHAASGWNRFPTFAEMGCLAFLSVVHGSRGIYFYTYKQIVESEEKKDQFEKVVRRLNSLRSWLEVKNSDETVPIDMTTHYSVDPAGNPAVHCAVKEQYGTQMLMCINTLRTYVEAEVGVAAERSRQWSEYFTGEPYYVVDDNVLLRFEPLEVKVLMEKR